MVIMCGGLSASSGVHSRDRGSSDNHLVVGGVGGHHGSGPGDGLLVAGGVGGNVRVFL